MSLCRALGLVSALTLAGVAVAWAQATPFPPVPAPGGQASPFPPPPPPPGQSGAASQPGAAPPVQRQSSPFAPGGGQFENPLAPRSASICEQFPSIRAQAEKDATAIKAASDRQAPREEVCAAFNKFMGSEGRMVKFLETNQAACGVPPDAIKQVKTQHARTLQIRKQVCSAGPAPRGPSLSDALGGPILPEETPKPGRGTFDTLTGNALGR